MAPAPPRTDDALRVTSPDGETLAFAGALTFGTVARGFADGRHLLDAGAQTCLDLAGVTRVDSAGLACVLALAADVNRAGRRLRVLNWPQGLRSLAEVCDVAELLEPPA